MRDARKVRSSGGGAPRGAALWLVLAALLLAGRTALCADWPQFRGPNRDGKSAETGLLKQWPEGGPPLIWSVEDLGHGYTTVAVVDGMLYTTGMDGKTGSLYAYDLDGEPQWKREYGPDWVGDRSGARALPTVNDGLLYIISSHGRVVCLDAATGDEKWAVDTKKEFGARVVRWGIVGALLVDGDNLICTPGGIRACVVALNKKTGETVWISEGLNDASAYCSPILIEHGGVVVHDGYVYGASDQNARGQWVCLDLSTGKTSAMIPGVRKGSIAYADGMLYGYGESGMVGLMKASPTEFELVSSFKITKGNKQHWAHPVIANGRLYIRHGNALMAYDVKAR